jgi:hypothetical protein
MFCFSFGEIGFNGLNIHKTSTCHTVKREARKVAIMALLADGKNM